ncbi:MAG: TonB family protein [Candidatus Aminicenantes bacterium]|nr:TonB family protein [Candidatus Aminicenantes bacterium]NIM81206.1 TonB family protein [Candidatus Aminicenantes bacterium]NIN20581.1 TonB family protein [Candidatus Aminicenantes bacterium]NIN44360.1 TonB family protein [Candidatus Aminicenantes bacterium]NIN87179.1 TonB family protein [Candidatus Aminicenantes bacterium]
MKLKVAIILSVVMHLSIFAIALYLPAIKGSSKGTVYYVDLINMPGGGGGGGKGGTRPKQDSQLVQEPQRMKDLTAKKQEPQSKLRYPDENLKKSKKKKKRSSKKKKPLITVVKKDRTKNKKDRISVTRKTSGPDNVLKTGISAGSGGSGGGSGGGYGTGTGTGYGPGSGSGGFPYAYYIETLRSKISSSWYSALVSPGLRGRFVAVVYFKISRNGRIQDLKLEEKSGINALDLSALRAVENAAPFPPLPNTYAHRYLGVHFEFIWEKK